MFFVIGHQEGEGRDVLIRLSWSEMRSRSEILLDRVKNRKYFYDYSYRVALGSGVADEVVVFRDPEDAEETGDYEDDDYLRDVECFCGLYIRRLSDNQLIEQIPYDGAVKSGAPLYATATMVAVVYPDHVDFVPRVGAGGTRQTLHGRAFSLDAAHGRLACLTEANEVHIYNLADVTLT